MAERVRGAVAVARLASADEHGALDVDAAGAEALRRCGRRVVAVVGPAGDGKSALCAALLGCVDLGADAEAPVAAGGAFAPSDAVVSAGTTGVWVGAGADGTGVLDCEGLDLGRDAAELAQTLLAAALASTVLYNVRGPRVRAAQWAPLRHLAVARRAAAGAGAPPFELRVVLRDVPPEQLAAVAPSVAAHCSELAGFAVRASDVLALPAPAATRADDFLVTPANESWRGAVRELRAALPASPPRQGDELAALAAALAPAVSALMRAGPELAVVPTAGELEAAFARVALEAAEAADADAEREDGADRAAAAAEVAALPGDTSSDDD